MREYEVVYTSDSFTALGIGLGMLSLFVIIVVHELIHGLFFKLFNPQGKVRFGFTKGVAYATSPNSFYSKKQFFWISISPFVSITVLLYLLLVIGWISPAAFAIIASIHAGACIGDFYWIYLLMKAPQRSLVEDTEVGIHFYEATD